MNAVKLKEAVATLPSYEVWSSVTTALDPLAREAVATKYGDDVVARIKAELAFVEGELDVSDVQAYLAAEVAGAKSTIDLPYRLGILAVWQNPIRRMARKHSRIIDLAINGLPETNDDIPISDFAWPPLDPYERAVRIGDALVATAGVVNRRAETPIAYLFPGRLTHNGTRETNARYYLIPRRKHGLTFEEPLVVYSDYEPEVYFKIPRITAATAAYDQKKHKVVPVRSLYGTKSFEIPSVRQLQGSRKSGKLLFDRDVVCFAERNAEELEERVKKTRDFDDFIRTARF